MAKKLFVGNLAYAITDDQLTQIFSAHGTVVSAKVISDRFSGRSKGFGFIEFETDEEATAAMQALDGSEQDGRNMVVKEANPPREEGGMTAAPAAPAPEAPVEEAPAPEVEAPVEAAPAPEAPAEEEAPAEKPAVEEVEAPVEEAPAEEEKKE